MQRLLSEVVEVFHTWYQDAKFCFHFNKHRIQFVHLLWWSCIVGCSNENAGVSEVLVYAHSWIIAPCYKSKAFTTHMRSLASADLFFLNWRGFMSANWWTGLQKLLIATQLGPALTPHFPPYASRCFIPYIWGRGHIPPYVKSATQLNFSHSAHWPNNVDGGISITGYCGNLSHLWHPTITLQPVVSAKSKGDCTIGS